MSQIAPRYGGEPVIDLDAVLTDPGEACTRQRARLAAVLAASTPEEWQTPSRCEGWSVQDVVEHLATATQFWALSIRSGVDGEPTRLLATFDPAAGPAAMVAAVRGADVAVTRERFLAANRALDDALASLGSSDWSRLAEAPPGHLAIRAVVAHALWDSWIHERDILLPLGREPTIEPDEVEPALAYAAAVGPGFRCAAGSVRTGTLAVVAHRPESTFRVEIGATARVEPGAAVAAGTAVIEGDAVDLLDALSYRAPMVVVPDADRWMVEGLGDAFARDA